MIYTTADANKTSVDDYYKISGTNGNPLSLEDNRYLSALNYRNDTWVGTDDTFAKASLADPKTSYSFQSLKSDELYRYGIILYDKYGNASPVKWIADIRTPIELPIYTNRDSDLTTS